MTNKLYNRDMKKKKEVFMKFNIFIGNKFSQRIDLEEYLTHKRLLDSAFIRLDKVEGCEGMYNIYL